MSKIAKSEPIVDKETKKVEMSEGVLNLKERVECVATKTHPYVQEGKVIICSPFVKAKAIAQGWAK
jgi:thymidylate kinase